MRIPNPWIAVPSLAGGAAGSFIAYTVAGAGCRSRGCLGTQIVWAVIGALIGLIGIGVVAVLAVLSLAEWAEHRRRLPR